jgi:hypothetical protein
VTFLAPSLSIASPALALSAPGGFQPCSCQVKSSRTLAAKFQKAWEASPSWTFVQHFQHNTILNEDEASKAKLSLTAKEMVDKYGTEAPNVMARKRSSGDAFIDPDDGVEKFKVFVETETKRVAARKEKGVTLTAEATAPSTGGASSNATPLALQDAGPAASPPPLPDQAGQSKTVGDLLQEKRGKRARRTIDAVEEAVPADVFENVKKLTPQQLVRLAELASVLQP